MTASANSFGGILTSKQCALLAAFNDLRFTQHYYSQFDSCVWFIVPRVFVCCSNYMYDDIFLMILFILGRKCDNVRLAIIYRNTRAYSPPIRLHASLK